jgi:hypothetical protein
MRLTKGSFVFSPFFFPLFDLGVSACSDCP